MLSQTAGYAVQAVAYLALEAREAPVRVDDIAEDLSVPRNYLSKILHVLARAGVLDSTRGPHGGFQLARSPEELTLGDIVGEFDTLAAEEAACLLGRSRCSDADPCSAHDRWKDVSGRVRDFFRETTVAELLSQPAGID